MAITLAAGVIAWVASASAHASPPSSDPGVEPTRAPQIKPTRTLDDALSVEPGVTCLNRATLLADLRSWRDQDEVDPRVTIRVLGSTEDPHTLGFTLKVGDEIAVDRSFAPAPDSCTDLHAVVALALAIALDDTLAGSLGIVEAPPPVEQIQAGDGDLPLLERHPRGSDATAPSRSGPALGLTVAPAAFMGLTPALSGGGELLFDVRPLAHFDVRIGALATHLPNFALDQGRVGITVAAGRLDLCWGSTPRAVRLRTCAAVAAGATIAAGHDFSTNFRRSIPWLAGIAALDVAIQLVGPLALELRVEGVFPLQRTRIDVRSDTGQLLASQRLPVAAAVVAVGPRFEF
ncbi:hypothetical protein DB30_04733 [Enhygromyxa salina]|uniref:Uncharacterized protein n=1 Tax=Enhygromyxa salina TaxID=215803 RepID=A0A0C1ZYI5_9BACT|nr:hypothetical protein [Enhygromyxa salina]KIG16273.1 hypothetical protein DB30_04733 [Enhygromyxa salina]